MQYESTFIYTFNEVYKYGNSNRRTYELMIFGMEDSS